MPVQFLLRQAVLAKLAYVHLCLEDPVSALSAAAQLLLLPCVMEPWRYLGHMYAVEALSLLNHHADVQGLLVADLVPKVRGYISSVVAANGLDASTQFPVSSGTPPPGFSDAEVTATYHVALGVSAFLQVCMGSCACVRACVSNAFTPYAVPPQGDMARASENASAALVALPQSVEARRLAVCVCLYKGDNASAASLLSPGPLPHAASSVTGGAVASAGAARGAASVPAPVASTTAATAAVTAAGGKPAPQQQQQPNNNNVRATQGRPSNAPGRK